MRDLEGDTLQFRPDPEIRIQILKKKKIRAEGLRWLWLKTTRHACVKTNICAAARLLGKCCAVPVKRVSPRGTAAAAASVIWFFSMGRASEFKMV